MQVKIIKSTLAPKGKVFTIRSAKKDYRILFTNHSIDRAAKWRLHLEDVAECLLNPDEVLKGHSGRFIAQSVTIGEEEFMRIRYSKDADVCIIELRKGKLADSVDIKEGVILHLDSNGKPVEIEILDASKVVSFDEMSFSIPVYSVNDSIPAAG